MSDERTIKIAELNKRIDELIAEYKGESEECIQELGDEHRSSFYSGKIEALEELKIELNDPEPSTDLTENVQQSLNLIEAKKIITPPKDGQNTDI